MNEVHMPGESATEYPKTRHMATTERSSVMPAGLHNPQKVQSCVKLCLKFGNTHSHPAQQINNALKSPVVWKRVLERATASRAGQCIVLQGVTRSPPLRALLGGKEECTRPCLLRLGHLEPKGCRFLPAIRTERIDAFKGPNNARMESNPAIMLLFFETHFYRLNRTL
ncbi:hypothetical protein BJX66DRAFT_128874 [Aspergillus keveii]|uniref:Uncharacterized protein n=1 Tax=Aspergillus keveii TaxID=714993 RepID=A0ABR4GCH0_9EURO